VEKTKQGALVNLNTEELSTLLVRNKRALRVSPTAVEEEKFGREPRTCACRATIVIRKAWCTKKTNPRRLNARQGGGCLEVKEELWRLASVALVKSQKKSCSTILKIRGRASSSTEANKSRKLEKIVDLQNHQKSLDNPVPTGSGGCRKCDRTADPSCSR